MDSCPYPGYLRDDECPILVCVMVYLHSFNQFDAFTDGHTQSPLIPLVRMSALVCLVPAPAVGALATL